MGATEVDLESYVRCEGRDEAIEKILLAGLTQAALADNDWARSEIASIGFEFGVALAAFVWAFEGYESVSNIVLVSTVAERLGRGVTGPGVQEDLLIDNLRDAMAKALIARGMEDEKAVAISHGVRRSKIGRERELLAFDPAHPSQFLGGMS
jgi:hypothetical protein